MLKHRTLALLLAGSLALTLGTTIVAADSGTSVPIASAPVQTEAAAGEFITVETPVEVLPDDTPEVLQKRIMEQCEWKILPLAVSLFCQNKLTVDGRTVHILP